MMSRLLTLTVASLLGSTLAACGTNSQPEPTAGGASATTPAAATAPAAAPAVVHDGRKIEITADDKMKFSVVELTATPGERLSVTLVNKGTTPKFSMGHNWLLLSAGVDIAAFLISAAESPTTEYVPAAKKADILAATKLLGPFDQDTATFNAPSAPGRYPFLCSFPGHAQVGMQGVLIVK